MMSYRKNYLVDWATCTLFWNNDSFFKILVIINKIGSIKPLNYFINNGSKMLIMMIFSTKICSIVCGNFKKNMKSLNKYAKKGHFDE